MTTVLHNHPEAAKKSTPTDYLTHSLEINLASLPFRLFADFPMMKENRTASHRHELNHNYLNKHPTPSTPSPSHPFAISLIRSELETFGINNTPNYSESNLVAATFHPSKNHIPDILRSLLWRSHQQRLVFKTFIALCHLNLCTLSALSQPVDYHTVTPIASRLHKTLMSYSAFTPLYKPGSKVVPLEHETLEWQEVSYPIIWLEVMLLRSATSIGDTFGAMTSTGFLGTFDRAHFEQVSGLEQEWARDGEALVGWQPRLEPCFGFMLPSGVGTLEEGIDAESVQWEFCRRLGRVEEAFERYFLVPGNEGVSVVYQTDGRLI